MSGFSIPNVVLILLLGFYLTNSREMSYEKADPFFSVESSKRLDLEKLKSYFEGLVFV